MCNWFSLVYKGHTWDALTWNLHYGHDFNAQGNSTIPFKPTKSPRVRLRTINRLSHVGLDTDRNTESLKHNYRESTGKSTLFWRQAWVWISYCFPGWMASIMFKTSAIVTRSLGSVAQQHSIKSQATSPRRGSCNRGGCFPEVTDLITWASPIPLKGMWSKKIYAAQDQTACI